MPLVLLPCGSELCDRLGFGLANGEIASFVVPRGNALAPPQLAADAPVAHVLHPVAVGVGEFLRMQFHLAAHHHVQRGLRHLAHLHEPLQRQARLDDGIGAFARAHLVHDVLRLHYVALLLQQFHESFFLAMKRSSPTKNCAAALMVPFGSKVSITASLCACRSHGRWCRARASPSSAPVPNSRST
jgi:hypothetical protein